MNITNNDINEVLVTNSLIDPLTMQNALNLYVKKKGIYVWDSFTKHYRSVKTDACLTLDETQHIVWELSY